MPAKFPIQRDEEFYVFLKSGLEEPFRIESEPSASYYSEWQFNYKLYKGGAILKVFEGDYRTIERGTLIQEALKIMGELEMEKHDADRE